MNTKKAFIHNDYSEKYDDFVYNLKHKTSKQMKSMLKYRLSTLPKIDKEIKEPTFNALDLNDFNAQIELHKIVMKKYYTKWIIKKLREEI